MNYLVTGATGFIGRSLVDVLLAQGHNVNYAGRKRDARMDSRAAFFVWNSEEEPPLECMGRLDAVVHLAGEPVAQRWTPEVKKRIRDSRVVGTRNVVSAIGRLKHRPPVLVSASAIGYYGDQGDRELTEADGPGRSFLAEVCARWEEEAVAARPLGVRVVPLRISVVLGNGGALEKMSAPFRYGLGGKLASGKQWMSWIHVKDLHRMMQFAVENEGIDEVLNAAAPGAVRNDEFTRELARRMRRPALFTVPRFALRLAMGEVADHMLESIRVLPAAAVRHGFTFAYPDLPSALQQAGLGT